MLKFYLICEACGRKSSSVSASSEDSLGGWIYGESDMHHCPECKGDRAYYQFVERSKSEFSYVNTARTDFMEKLKYLTKIAFFEGRKSAFIENSVN